MQLGRLIRSNKGFWPGVPRLPATAVAISALLAIASPCSADNQPKMTEFGVPFTQFDASLNKSRDRIMIKEPDFGIVLRYYRLRFLVTNPDTTPWTVTIRSAGGQVLSTFDQTDKRCESKDGCWTVRLNATPLTVRFDTPSGNAQADIPNGLYMPAEAERPFYSEIQGSNVEEVRSLNLAEKKLSEAYDRAANLGMLIGSGPGADGRKVNWCCSGVRLGADLFMTNWHCGAAEGMQDSAFWNESESFHSCRASLVDLSWDEDPQGREYACRSVEFKDKNLDVAILRLAPLADGPPLTRPLSVPKLSDKPVAAGQQIEIFHHPACKPKSITRNCSIKQAMVPSWTDSQQNNEFSHSCTTENGSSGGPVYSTDGMLVGLHHLGFKEGEAERANYAVGTDAILTALKQRNAALFQEITGAAP